MKKKLVIGLVVAAVVLTTIFAGASVLAQTGTGPANPGSGVYLDSPLLARLAAALGLTPTELSTELGTGKTLATIAQERNIATEALVDAIIAPHAGMLALRVKYDYLTAEQSQALLEAAKERASLLLEQDLSGATGSGNFGHCGGYMGGFGPGTGMMGNYGSGYSGMMGPGMMGRWGPYYNNPNTQSVNPNPTPGVSPSSRFSSRGWGMMGGGFGDGMMGRW